MVANAQNAGEGGWTASGDQRNRFALVDNILSQTFKPLRKAAYDAAYEKYEAEMKAYNAGQKEREQRKRKERGAASSAAAAALPLRECKLAHIWARDRSCTAHQRSAPARSAATRKAVPSARVGKRHMSSTPPRNGGTPPRKNSAAVW